MRSCSASSGAPSAVSLAHFLGFLVQLFVFGHAINLVSAFAVKSTMGTTRA